MLPVINEALLAVSNSFPASIVLKATVAATLVLIGVSLMRTSRAALRHALLAVAFGVLLLLPIATALAPPVRIAIPTVVQEQIVSPPLASAIDTTPSTSPMIADATPAIPQPPRISLPALLITLWLSGAALFLLPMIFGLWQVRSLRRSALPWRQGQSLADELALDAGIHRRIDLVLHDASPGPMTCGILRPAILLPLEAQNWNPDELNRALVHELEHVRRGDWATHCLARIVCAMYWFHPLVWIAARQLALEAERSCDDAVLRRSEATAYADQLVGLARRLSTLRKSPALAMASRADLSARVGAVLDSRQQRGRAGKVLVALACIGAALFVLTISPITIVAATQSFIAHATPTPVIAETSAPAITVAPRINPPAGRKQTPPRLLAQASPVTPQPSLQAVDTQAIDLTMIRFISNTAMVLVNVTVSHQNGEPVEDLTANDFSLREDDRPQQISVFEFQKLPTAPQGAANYFLGYYSTNSKRDGQYRKITVKLNTDAQDLKLRFTPAGGVSPKLDYRSGYIANASFGAAGRDDVVKYTGPEITPPSLISKFDPEYSEEARKEKYNGTVVLNVEIGSTGDVTGIDVVRPIGMGLDEKAIEAVRRWKFRPAVMDGKSVAVKVEIDMNFRLL